MAVLALSGVVAFACGGGKAGLVASRAASALVAFSSDRDGHPDVFVVSSNGSPRPLTDSPSSDRSPVFSPNGKTILFVSDRVDDNNDIWRVGVDGTGLKRLTTSTDDDQTPGWSHDGKRIVYSNYHFAGYDLYTMRSDGSGKKSIANDLSDDVQPRWSPDARRVAFIRTCQVPELCMKHAANRSDGLGELYVVGAAGGKQQRLAKTLAAESDPQWSPSGRSIAFVATVGSNSDIWTVAPSGKALKRLTRGAGLDADPQWSPNGRRLAYMSVRGGHGEIYSMNPDGSGQRNLTRDPGDDTDPRWSPDGKKIYFLSSREGDPKPFVMNADGSGQRGVADLIAPYGDLSVGPGR
jgi:Tol biopolymer transport system component